MKKSLKSQQGFTLVELLVYTTLTAIIVGLFGAILITITRVQGEQSGSTQVTREMNFLMAAIRQRINDASEITSTGSGTLSLTDSSGQSVDIDLQDGVIMLTEGGEPAAPLSTDQIVVDQLTFTEYTDTTHASSTAVEILMTISVNTNNPQQAVTRTLRSTAAPFLLAQ